MNILITPKNPSNTSYLKTLGGALAERGYTFFGIGIYSPLLLIHRLRGTKICIATTHRAAYCITLPARLLGIKVFWVESRLIDRALKRSIPRALYRFLSRYVTIVVASRAIRQQLIDYGINTERIHTIAPGISIEDRGVQKSLFGSIAEQRSRRKVGFAIGAISALEKEKGLEYLLHAFKIAREHIPDLHLTIIGQGPERSALQWVAKKLGVAEYVLFVGWQDNGERWLASFDLIVAPQLRKEGFGEFLLLAMAYGKPIIATDVGSFPEIIERRKTGIIIEAGNATMLAEAIVNLYHHPEWREEMGKRARERVEEYFSLAQMVNAWDVLFKHE